MKQSPTIVKKRKTTKAVIRPIVVTSDDGTITIAVVNVNGRPSDAYQYKSSTGKLEKVGKVPIEWIGSISASPDPHHRVWVTVANILERFEIPTDPKELGQFIAAIGEDKLFYHVKFTDGKFGSFYLPYLLRVAKQVQSSKKVEGVISHVAVAPHRQRQGFGRLLHILMASHLKALGYTKMTSDIVGLNTDGEIAVWRALEKEVTVTPFNSKVSCTRILKDLNIIDNTMFKWLRKEIKMHVGAVVMTEADISRRKFLQFELDLTDERIPILVKKAA